MKPYEVAEIVGFRESFDPLEVEKSFGSLLYHDGKEVILLRNNNNYFYVDSEPNTFKNQLYEIKIVYSPHKETKPQKLTSEDVLKKILVILQIVE